MDRSLSVDLLKIVMALFVVGIHVNPLHALGPDTTILLGGGLFRVAVPVFFVINGYFLEPVLQARKVSRYVGRVLVLYAIWTALYLPAWYQAFFHPEPWAALRYLVMGWWQLWYLPGLALAAGLATLVHKLPVRWIITLILICFIAGVGITYAMALDLLHPSKRYFGDVTMVHRNGLFTGFPFLMAGVLIRRYQIERNFSFRALLALAVGSLILVMIEGVAMFVGLPKGVNHDNMLTLALASPVLVLLALKVPWQSQSRTLGTYANGLFFLHVAFVVIGFRHTDLPRFWIYAMAVAGSLSITWVLIRTGLARRLL